MMQDLWVLLEVYWLSMFVAAYAGALLAQFGSQLAGRDQSLQVFCLSQGALTGVLLGLLMIMFYGGVEALHASVEGHSVVPGVTALAFAAVLSVLLERVNHGMAASRNTIFIALFCILISLNSLISRLFPALEQQFSRVFFGNFTTASIHALEVLAGFTFVLGIAYLKRWRTYTRETFEYAFFGFFQENRVHKKRLVFELSVLAYICVCIQTIGFVGTLALLFLPTVLVRFWRVSHIGYHLIAVSLLAMLAVPLGFILSLMYPGLPTISMMVLMMVGLAFLGFIAQRVRRIAP